MSIISNVEIHKDNIDNRNFSIIATLMYLFLFLCVNIYGYNIAKTAPSLINLIGVSRTS